MDHTMRDVFLSLRKSVPSVADTLGSEIDMPASLLLSRAVAGIEPAQEKGITCDHPPPRPPMQSPAPAVVVI